MSSIIAPLEGCVALDDLESANAQLIWFIVGPDRHRAGAWQADRPGCAPTTHHQRALLIEGGTQALRNPSPDSPLAIEFEWDRQIPCGRFQIDIHNAVTDEMKALVIDTGVVCHGRPPHAGPPIVIHPPQTPPNAPPAIIPEPGTMALLGGALLARAAWMRLWR